VPRKIALISDWYLPHIGGVEYQMRDLARELGRRGHQVHIVTVTPGPPVVDGLRIDRLNVPIIRRYGIAWNKQALAPLERLILRERFDVIHGHGLYAPLSFMAVYLARKHRIPSVLTNHSILGRAGIALFAALECRYRWSAWPDVLSAVSSLAADETARASGRPVMVLRNGIDPGDWSCRRDPSPVTRIASVMRFSTRKAPHGLIRAIPRVLSRLSPAERPRFTIAGDGVHRRRLEREVARLGVAAHVEFRGFMKRDDLRQMLAASQLFVHPTVKEAFGIVLLEARAAGLPVIAMGQSGARDIVDHGRTGLLAGDHHQFADHIVSLVRDHALRRRMTVAAPDGLEPYSVPRVADQHLETYARAGACS
jgi:phosphatidylinositol alpha 1,6-mannosyltransferase